MKEAHDFTRREFASAAGAAVAALFGGSFPAQAADERRILVGGHPWVYAAKLPQYDITPKLDEIFADMKYAGLDGVELMSSALAHDGAVDRIQALSKAHSLPVIGASFGGNMWDRKLHAKVLADARLAIPRLAAVGGRTLGISVGSTKELKTPAEFDAQAECLRTIMGICAEHGVVPNLHNHTYEVKDGMHDLRGTLERIPDAKLGPDLNWLVRGGVDPVAFIAEFGKQIVFLHLRDQRADGQWSEAMGEGDMDYAAIGQALERAGFSGDAVIELAHERAFVPTRPIRESFKMSREFVRKTVGF